MENINKYEKGKIYKIVSNETEKIYIGSTIEKYLSNRKGKHIDKYKSYLNKKYNYVSSFELVIYPDCKIYLIESYPCNNINELLSRERYWIEQNKDICVNIYIPSRTREERRNKTINCSCGKIIKSGNMFNHKKSKFHISRL